MTDIDTLIKFLQPSSKRPGALYKQLANSLTDAIRQSLLQPGNYLIAERDLAHKLNISRVTVRKSISVLVAQGRLIQNQGVGTMVCEQPHGVLHKSLSSLNGFTDDMNQRGFNTKSKLVSRQERQATTHEAMILKLKPTDLICQLSRVRLLNNMPLAFEKAVIPADIIPQNTKVDTSLYATLAEQNMVPVRAAQTIQAVNAAEKIAEQLEIACGDAILFMERQGFAKGGRVVEYTQSYYRGDRYDYTVELK